MILSFTTQCGAPDLQVLQPNYRAETDHAIYWLVNDRWYVGFVVAFVRMKHEDDADMLFAGRCDSDDEAIAACERHAAAIAVGMSHDLYMLDPARVEDSK